MNNENTKKSATVDDLLGPVEKTRSKNEAITFLPLSDLYSFPDHPYQVRQDEALTCGICGCPPARKGAVYASKNTW